MTEAELKRLTLASAVRLIAEKRLSPDELISATVSRVERLNPEMGAFISLSRDFDRTPPGPLHGVPLSVKDLYDTAGMRTTAGSKVFADRIPDEDSTVVKKLKEAGAVIIGKNNLHEFAFGVTTINPHYGIARNPWDRNRIPGGSSGGSATAVGLSLGLASIGSDTEGSIRIPSALCGIVGFKPTYGRVSLQGVVPLSWSLDHGGPMTRTVEDAALLMEIIAEHHPIQLTGNIKGVRVGIPINYFYERLAPEVDHAVRTAIRQLEKLGAEPVEIEMPGMPIHRACWFHIASPEAYSYHEVHLQNHAGLYGADIRGRLEAGRVLLSIDYVRAQRARTLLREQCRQVFERVDVIVTPTTPITAPRIEDVHKPWGDGPETAAASLTRLTRYFNIVGLPAISIPCGFSSEGLPIGMQIVGKAYDESTVLRVAHAYEQDARWFERQPEM